MKTLIAFTAGCMLVLFMTWTERENELTNELEAAALTPTSTPSIHRTDDMYVFVDPLTGCHYLVPVDNGGIVKRTQRGGQHVGCR